MKKQVSTHIYIQRETKDDGSVVCYLRVVDVSNYKAENEKEEVVFNNVLYNLEEHVRLELKVAAHVDSTTGIQIEHIDFT